LYVRVVHFCSLRFKGFLRRADNSTFGVSFSRGGQDMPDGETTGLRIPETGRYSLGIIPSNDAGAPTD
jgi:hypothetical protein